MFKVASYNIKCGAMTGFDCSMQGCDLKNAGADIAGIQEVDEHTERNGFTQTMAPLSKFASLSNFQFAEAMPYKGGSYGIGILSRYKPKGMYTAHLPLQSGLEPRVFCAMLLEIDNNPLYFINTHLSYESVTLQKEQMSALGKYLSTLKYPFVLTGDFNTEDFTLFDILSESIKSPIQLMNSGKNRFASFYPTGSEIDNIVISKGLKFTETGMYTKSKNSDHYMIYAQIEFEKQIKP